MIRILIASALLVLGGLVSVHTNIRACDLRQA